MIEMSPDKFLPLNNGASTLHANADGMKVMFLGWTAEKDTRIYSINDEAPAVLTKINNTNRDSTVYAVWGYDSNNNGTPDVFEPKYSVIYDVNGGDAGSGPADDTGLKPGAHSPLNAETRPTHADVDGTAVAFLGWTAAKDSVIYDKDDEAPHCLAHADISDSDVTVYAAWAYDASGNGIPDLLDDRYALIYDENGGIDNSGPADETGLFHDTSLVLNYAEAPVRDSVDGNAVTFIGWFNNPDSHIYGKLDTLQTTSLESVYIKDEDVTVYAAWGYDENGNGTPDYREHKYVLTYDANGGVNSPPPAEWLLPGTLLPLDANVTPVRKTSSGADIVFAGWSDIRYETVFKRGGGMVPMGLTNVLIADGDVTVYAMWITDGAADGSEDKPDGGGDSGENTGGPGKKPGGGDPKEPSDSSDTNSGGGDSGENTDDPGTKPGGGSNKPDNPPVKPDLKPAPTPGHGNSTAQPPEDEVPKGHMLAPNEDGGYWEIDKNGKIAGVWTYDADLGKWTFKTEIPQAGMLFTDDHIWYLRGYSDNTIHPDSPITRAEVAMVFYRLLNRELRVDITHSIFPDVSTEDWHGEAINTLAYYGLVYGYPDGAFQPYQPITRAEISAIVSRFEKLAKTDKNPYSDINPDNWAYSYILSATEKGWFKGDESGGFRPDDNNTRAEFVAVVNRILDRKIRLFSIPADVHAFDDLTAAHWAYADLMESVYSHDISPGNEAEYEIWTEKTGSGLDAA
jgi:hypothetical protein